MTDLYKQGASKALKELGLEDEKGSPFPNKSKAIHAERLAEILQQFPDDTKERIHPENGRPGSKHKPISWGPPTNISGLDEGMGNVAGMIVPSNPRG